MRTLSRCLFAGLLVALFFGTTVSHASSERIHLPGTGVSLIPPENVRLAPAGSTLMDESGEIVISFFFGEAKNSSENDRLWRALYQGEPEHVSGQAWSGRLYQRTRAKDGGEWDGWFMAIPRGESVLLVTAHYSGNSPQTFAELREHLLSLVWDHSAPDAELAAGVRLAPRGLRLVTGVFGGLLYNRTGQVGETKPGLWVQVLPVAEGAMNMLSPDTCELLFGQYFGEKPFVGPELSERANIRACEAWSPAESSEVAYIALLRLPTKASLFVIGMSKPEEFKEDLPVFRSAVERLQVIPARNPTPAQPQE